MRDNWQGHYRRSRNKDKTVFGLIIIGVGVILALKVMGIIPFRLILTSWPLLLIGLGIFLGVRNRFSTPGPWVLLCIGVANLIPRDLEIYNGTTARDLLAPAILITVGAFIAFRSRKKKYFTDKDRLGTITNNDAVLNVDVTFGGRKEIITSKDFKGGSVSATFAGAEVNLIQADSLTQPIVLDIRVAFGGVELIVPSHWEVQNNITPAFGSVEDHRVMRTPNAGEERKILSLKGSCTFGSIEIKSY
ncbi:MAG: hypothetical protein JNL72_02470 [Flavipsychrobacter sp.]|nr:hypothetical protein [Flavipsychrobacter sp.]